MKVVAWKCHVCQKEIAETLGQACSRCNLIACCSHLLTVKNGKPGEKQRVCSKCITDGDNVLNIRYRVKRAFSIKRTKK